MSFQKVLKCDNCSFYFPISETAFPEDLYDLIIKYAIDQLFWICKNCKMIKDEQKTGIRQYLVMNPQNVAEEFHDSFSQTIKNFENINLKSPNIVPSRSSDSSFDDSYSSDYFLSEESDSFGQKSSYSCSPKNIGAHKILQQILKESKPKEEEKKKCTEVVKVFLDKTIEELRKDPDFNYIYKEPYYTGSFYNAMRVRSADEYDIDIVLKIPHGIPFNLEFDSDGSFMYTKIRCDLLEQLPEKEKMLKFLKNLSIKTDEGTYLSQKKINSWFQSLMDKCTKKISYYSEDIINVKIVQSGPARTSKITTSFGVDIYIDLVPVFCIDHSVFKSYPRIFNILLKYPVSEKKEMCFLVPKPLKFDDSGLLWKLDFPEVEKVILGKKFCAKTVIRLVKLLRDNMGWKGIASYYIKTVVLFEIDKNPNDAYWADYYLYERFIEILEKLRACLDNRRLPFFFSPDRNLISDFNEDQCKNWSNKLKRHIQEIQKDYNVLHEILKVNDS